MPAHPPPRRPVRFKEREVARALRAARLGGETPTGVEIDPATGLIRVIIGKSDAAAATTTNEWDEDGEASTKAR
jgi:hypothetical protein